MVIMCTDGLANTGFGALDNDIEVSKATELYKKIGEEANKKGVIINAITIKGEECNVLTLGSLADITHGKIIRVNPLNIQDDFANVLKD